MSRPEIEVIIPVHDASRPLARTIESLDRADFGDRLAITVVAHNIPASAITDGLDAPVLQGVTIESCDDGRNTPAGPRRLAMLGSTARYVCFVDSDDWLEPGALRAWLACADRHAARHGNDPAAIIAPERHASGKPIRNPPIRLLRTRLDPLRDRLPYRSAVRGLYSTAAIREQDIDFGTTGGNGSDLAFSLGMWYSGRALLFAGGTPAYVLGDDGAVRVTRTPRPLSAELAACSEILESPWFAGLPEIDRRLVATKFVRMHLIPGLVSRVDTAADDQLDRIAADGRAFLQLTGAVAPGYERVLALLHRRIADVLLETDADPRRLRRLARDWHAFRPLDVAFTRNPLDLLRRDAPPRWVTAMLLLPLRMRRPSGRRETVR